MYNEMAILKVVQVCYISKMYNEMAILKVVQVFELMILLISCYIESTVKPVYNGHSMEKQKVAVKDR